MKPGRRGLLGGSTAAGLLLLLALTGCGGATTAAPGAAALPAAAASSPAPTETASPDPDGSSPATTQAPQPHTSTPTPVPTTPVAPAVLAASDPVALSIPAIGLRTDLLSLGLRDDGSLQVPDDTGNGAPAGWYNGSPTPGARGPAVILGHVNALGGHKGVFADLRKVTVGAEINVYRADGSTAVFRVDHGASYSKGDFPTLEVYGNTAGAELRLITCDGYNPATGLFDDNYVIYAKLQT
ncbi:MAG: class F sortase [Pseudarthrobacter sp.]|nr:class F sortase [Pseudarthrobacter sp.]